MADRITGESPLAFQATFMAPPPGAPRQQVSLSAPFTFMTDLLITDTFLGNFEPLLDLHLSGHGLATVNLTFGDCPDTPFDVWFLNKTSYTFTPTPVPEPATLLLWARGLRDSAWPGG